MDTYNGIRISDGEPSYVAISHTGHSLCGDLLDRGATLPVRFPYARSVHKAECLKVGGGVVVGLSKDRSGRKPESTPSLSFVSCARSPSCGDLAF